jgi:hypothetical protein
MKKYGLFVFLVFAGVLTLFVNSNSVGNYVWKAYFYPGSSSAIRGYPTISQSEYFTGTWIDYSYTGNVLATQEYVNGKGHGNGAFYDDNGSMYFSRVLDNGRWKSSGESKGVPEKIVIPWFFPQRWVNRSLNRLEILDDIFQPKPVVYIDEVPDEKSHNKPIKQD